MVPRPADEQDFCDAGAPFQAKREDGEKKIFYIVLFEVPSNQ